MRIKRSLFSAFLLLVVILPMSAQEGNLVNIGLQARVDYQREYLGGDAVKGNCGFKGKNVSILINGAFNEHFSYNYRQRLYRGHGSESFFNATDFLYLTYRPDERWSFSGGKQIVEIGGYEYDIAPIDIYFFPNIAATSPATRWESTRDIHLAEELTCCGSSSARVHSGGRTVTCMPTT